MNKISLYKNTSGFTLLEVMVAMVIFAIGLLGLAGLQSQSLGFNHSAQLRSQAVYLAYDIIDRMRANKTSALAGAYDTEFSQDSAAISSSSCFGTSATCNPTDLATFDLDEWKESVENLPQGKSEITRYVTGTDTTFIVKLRWNDKLTADTAEIVVRSEI